MRFRTSHLFPLLAFSGLACIAPALADDADWPQFLGPQRNGHSSATDLNTNWERQKPRVSWKVPLGNGFSAPILVDGKIYTMAGRESRDRLFCYSAEDGKELWNEPLGLTWTDRQGQGPGPRSTPTYADGKIYCLLPRGDAFCVNAADRQVVWKTNIFTVSGAPDRQQETYYWGMSASPLVEGELVIFQPGGEKGNSVIALNRGTGQMVWKAGSDRPGYASPIAIDSHKQRLIVAVTGQSLLGLRPSDGKVQWRYLWGNKYDCNCATPLWINQESMFVSSAYGTGCALFQLPIADAPPINVWRNKNLQNQFTNSMLIDGHIYGCHGDLGAVTLRCLDLKSGQLKWTARGPGKANLLAADGHLFCLTEDGDLMLVQANPEKYIERGQLPNVLTHKCWTPPIIVGKQLYARDESQMIRIDLSKH